MKEWLADATSALGVDEDSVELDEFDIDEILSGKKSQKTTEITDIVVIDENKELVKTDEDESTEEATAEGKTAGGGSVPKDMYLVENPGVRRIYVTIAVLLIFFSIIGVINSTMFLQDRIGDIRDRKALKDELALFVYPVVINDPPAYDSVDNLMDSTIINSAIWKIILTEEDKSRYASDIGVIYIPVYDVELAARSIFGTVPQNHISVHGAVQFIYSEQNNHYEIPENPILFSYSPLITEVTNVGGLYTATVDYIAPSPLAIAGIQREEEPIKTMIYTISRNGDTKTINSIANVEFELLIDN